VGLINWVLLSFGPKVEVKVLLFLLKCDATKLWDGVAIQLHDFVTSAVDLGKWLASHFGNFTSAKQPLVPF
jgi:hypothetical protein